MGGVRNTDAWRNRWLCLPISSINYKQTPWTKIDLQPVAGWPDEATGAIGGCSASASALDPDLENPRGLNQQENFLLAISEPSDFRIRPPAQSSRWHWVSMPSSGNHDTLCGCALHRSSSGFLKATGAPWWPMLLTSKSLLFKHIVNLMSFFSPMTAVSKLSMLYEALLTNFLTLYR